MNRAVELLEKPVAEEIYMIAGWRQWADAGTISSGLPHYLIDQTRAEKIGEIKPDGFYLYQIPGTHHLLRPEIKLEEGYRQHLKSQKNEFFYAGDEHKGLVIFLGEEPHMDIDRYVEAFFDVAEAIGVKRIAAVGGVYGAMPYDKDRAISCSYSLPRMKEELENYAVQFSNYQGGASIGSYFLDGAERRGLEYFVFYGFVPAYDLSQVSNLLQGMSVEHDFKAWYDLMRRFNYMFNLGIDLSELEEQADELTTSMQDKLYEVSRKMPQLNINQYMEQVAEDFTERPFMPLSDVWAQGLGDLFEDME
jgi:predicted ATP-grasp superfamily ATP-dependent carboligase